MRFFLPFLAVGALSVDAAHSQSASRATFHRAMKTLDLALLRLDCELERSLRAAAAQHRTLQRAAVALGEAPGPLPAPASVIDTLPRLLPSARATALVPLGRAISDDGWSLMAELASWPRAYQALGLGLPDPARAGRVPRPFEPTAELVATLHHEAHAVDRLWQDVARVHALVHGVERETRRLLARVERPDAAAGDLAHLRGTASALAGLLRTPLLNTRELRLSVEAHRLLRRYR